MAGVLRTSVQRFPFPEHLLRVPPCERIFTKNNQILRTFVSKHRLVSDTVQAISRTSSAAEDRGGDAAASHLCRDNLPQLPSPVTPSLQLSHTSLYFHLCEDLKLKPTLSPTPIRMQQVQHTHTPRDILHLHSACPAKD